MDSMPESNELFTDYALQLFTSYLLKDQDTILSVIESFKNDGLDDDYVFMPGLVYGMIYHMNVFLQYIAEIEDRNVEDVLSEYAVNYALTREHLLNNPLLNIAMVREGLSKVIQLFEEIEKVFENQEPFPEES